MTPSDDVGWLVVEVRVVVVPGEGGYWVARAESRWGSIVAHSRDRDRAVRYALGDLAALATAGAGVRP